VDLPPEYCSTIKGQTFHGQLLEATGSCSTNTPPMVCGDDSEFFEQTGDRRMVHNPHKSAPHIFSSLQFRGRRASFAPGMTVCLTHLAFPSTRDLSEVSRKLLDPIGDGP